MGRCRPSFGRIEVGQGRNDCRNEHGPVVAVLCGSIGESDRASAISGLHHVRHSNSRSPNRCQKGMPRRVRDSRAGWPPDAARQPGLPPAGALGPGGAQDDRLDRNPAASRVLSRGTRGRTCGLSRKRRCGIPVARREDQPYGGRGPEVPRMAGISPRRRAPAPTAPYRSQVIFDQRLARLMRNATQSMRDLCAPTACYRNYREENLRAGGAYQLSGSALQRQL